MEHFLLRGLWNANGPPGDEEPSPHPVASHPFSNLT